VAGVEHNNASISGDVDSIDLYSPFNVAEDRITKIKGAVIPRLLKQGDQFLKRS
jgi:hypothetical protein